MASLTVYSGNTDARVRSSSNVYATARGGANLMTDANGYFGQDLDTGTYYLGHAMLAFDCPGAGLPAGALITAATLTLKQAVTVGHAQDFTVQARAKDWGASVGTEDWVAGADMGALTLLATLDTANAPTANTAYAMTSLDALLAAISTTAVTRILLTSDRFVAGTTPSTHEFMMILLGGDATQANRPKLDLVYTAPHDPLGAAGYFGV
jgi:hypothetical protein